MNRNESDDARFEELMAREFPDGLVPEERPAPPPAPAEAASPTPPDPPTPPESTAPSETAAAAPPAEASVVDMPSDFRAWTPPEEPDEPFSPPPTPPARPWSPAGVVGTALVVLPVVLVIVAAFGVRLPMLVSVLAGLGFFLGVALLLHRLRRRPPTDGDGAVV